MGDGLVTQLLWNRGIKTKKEAEHFLNPDFIEHLHDPFLLPNMEKAAERILKAIEKNEKIGIWSDYDADGIPGGVLLHDFFELIGFKNFINYIPNRHTEGYGLSKEGLEELVEKEVELLITIDCGIRDNELIDYAKKLGMKVIITDHHEPGDKLPKAYAIVNPKLKNSKYPEKILCGSGVIWKIIQAILHKMRATPTHWSGQIRPMKTGFEKWLLDLVGIATLSDMVPLIGENRALAHFGLMVLRKSKRPGLKKLFYALRINKQNLNEDDVGFLITPRINAASRMGRPDDAFGLLTAKNETEADGWVKHLTNINNERKGAVASIVKEAKKKVREKIENQGEKPVIVLGNPNWRPALLGLAANSVAEEFNRPVFLWGREGSELIKGSCRSDGSTDLVALMERAKKAFTEFGGHKFSGGFSVYHEKIHTLEKALVEASLHTVKEVFEVLVDTELKVGDVNRETILKIEKLAPFGMGNEKPIFIFRDVIPQKINRFGKAQEHLSINLRDTMPAGRQGSHTARAISFFTAPDKFGDSLKEGIKTNLVANIEKSYFNGSSEIRLRIVDFFL